MTDPIKIMYKEAKNNSTFKEECLAADPENYLEPTWMWNDDMKVVFASIYYGWLVGKGIYVKSKYYK